MKKRKLFDFLLAIIFLGASSMASYGALGYSPDIPIYKYDGVTIDSSIADWNALPMFLVGKEDGKDYANYSGEDDFNAYYKAAYDDNNLYLLVNILKDDAKVILGETSDKPYQYDAVEILLDLDYSRSSSKQNDNDWQIRMFRDTNAVPYEGMFMNGFGHIPSVANVNYSSSESYPFDLSNGWESIGFDYQKLENDTGWSIEVAMPWSVLLQQDNELSAADMMSGVEIGFAVKPHDRDQIAVQDYLPFPSIASYGNHPVSWGKATLMEGGEKAPIYKLPAGMAMSIDGNYDPIWYSESIVANEISNFHTTDAFVLPDDEDDFSATWKAVYNDTGMFIMMEVTDQQVYRIKWNNKDVVELYYHFGDSVFPGSLYANDDKGYYQVPFNVDGAEGDSAFWAGIDYSFKKKNDGYVVEAFIGWSTFDKHGEAADPIAEGMFPFDILINDADTAADGSKVESRVYWQSESHLYNTPWITAGRIELMAEEATMPEIMTTDILKKPANSNIVIDGEYDPIWFADNITSNSIERVHKGSSFSSPEGSSDFSASWKALYDDMGMYLMLEVTDQQVYRIKWNKRDVVELYYHFGDSVFPGSLWNNDDKGYYQVPFHVDGRVGDTLGLWEDIEYTFNTTGNGYVVEAFIGWSTFDMHGEAANPVTGDVVPFDILINDADTTADGTNVDSRIYWSSYAHLYNNEWTNNVGEVTLSATEAKLPESLTAEALKIPATSGITVDGLATDDVWNSPFMKEYTIEREHTDGFVSVEDDTDFSATWKAAYNDAGMYYLLEVTDQQVYKIKWNKKDVIELYYHFGDSVFPGSLWGNDDKGYYQVPFNVDGAEGDSTLWEDIEYSFELTDDGYTVEAYIGWSTFDMHGEAANPTTGDTIPFDMLVNDADTLADGTNTNSRLYWSSILHLYNNDWDFVGSLILSEDEAITGEILTAEIPMVNSDSITIDGEINETAWQSTLVGPYKIEREHLDGYAPVEDDTDFSATWKAAYSDLGMYFLLEVTDQHVYKIKWNKKDVVELYYHFGDSVFPGSLWGNDDKGYYQIPFNVDGSEGDSVFWEDIDYTLKMTDDGYVVEAFIGWSTFDMHGEAANPVKGDVVPFDILINDADTTADGTNVNSRIYWSSYTHLYNNAWDWAGNVILSDTVVHVPVSINETVVASEFKIYPNPANSGLTIKGSDIESVRILDLTGRVAIYEDAEFSDLVEINVSELISGAYFVQVKSNGIITTKQFIKK